MTVTDHPPAQAGTAPPSAVPAPPRHCDGFDRCPAGLNREHYDRDSGAMFCSDCPGPPDLDDAVAELDELRGRVAELETIVAGLAELGRFVPLLPALDAFLAVPKVRRAIGRTVTG